MGAPVCLPQHRQQPRDGFGLCTGVLQTSEHDLRIGVGASLRLLRNRGRLIGRLFGPKIYRPDAFLHELAPQLVDSQLGVAGFHVFCFNRVEQSENWRRQFVTDLQQGTQAVAP